MRSTRKWIFKWAFYFMWGFILLSAIAQGIDGKFYTWHYRAHSQVSRILEVPRSICLFLLVCFVLVGCFVAVAQWLGGNDDFR